jgi:hypothetical protein
VKVVTVAVRCLNMECNAMLCMPLPMAGSDDFTVLVLRAGWACVGHLDHPGAAHVYCWECAEKIVPEPILAQHRAVARRLTAAFGDPLGRVLS